MYERRNKMNKYKIEYSVIKSIIYLYENKEESRGIEILSNIKNEYFTNDSCKRIISLMKNFMGQNKTFDRIIINSNLEADLRNTFNEIVATSISYLSINEYVNLLIDNYKETQIIEITSKAKNRLDKSRLEDPIDKIIYDSMQEFEALLSNEVSNLNDIKKIGDEFLENLFNPKFYVALRKPLNIDISDEPTKNSSSCFYILTFHAPPFNKIISNTLIALDFESA